MAMNTLFRCWRAFYSTLELAGNYDSERIYAEWFLSFEKHPKFYL